MDPGAITLIIVGGVLLWLLVNILLTGGSMAGGMTPAPRSGGRPASLASFRRPGALRSLLHLIDRSSLG